MENAILKPEIVAVNHVNIAAPVIDQRFAIDVHIDVQRILEHDDILSRRFIIQLRIQIRIGDTVVQLERHLMAHAAGRSDADDRLVSRGGRGQPARVLRADIDHLAVLNPGQPADGVLRRRNERLDDELRAPLGNLGRDKSKALQRRMHGQRNIRGILAVQRHLQRRFALLQGRDGVALQRRRVALQRKAVRAAASCGKGEDSKVLRVQRVHLAHVQTQRRTSVQADGVRILRIDRAELKLFRIGPVLRRAARAAIDHGCG